MTRRKASIAAETRSPLLSNQLSEKFPVLGMVDGTCLLVMSFRTVATISESAQRLGREQRRQSAFSDPCRSATGRYTAPERNRRDSDRSWTLLVFETLLNRAEIRGAAEALGFEMIDRRHHGRRRAHDDRRRNPVFLCDPGAWGKTRCASDRRRRCRPASSTTCTSRSVSTGALSRYRRREDWSG